MEIVITSGQILAFMLVCAVFLFGAFIGYLMGKTDSN